MTLVERKANAPRSTDGGSSFEESPRAARRFAGSAARGASSFRRARTGHHGATSSSERYGGRVGLSGELVMQAERVVDERVLDAVHLVRLRRFHWPVVLSCALVGAGIGSLAEARWYFVPALALVGMAVGMHLRTQFRLVVRTASRVVLVDASMVDASPRRVVAELTPAEVGLHIGRFWSTVTVLGQRHHTPARHARRIAAMLGR